MRSYCPEEAYLKIKTPHSPTTHIFYHYNFVQIPYVTTYLIFVLEGWKGICAMEKYLEASPVAELGAVRYPN
jgi:hypothetical protein